MHRTSISLVAIQYRMCLYISYETSTAYVNHRTRMVVAIVGGLWPYVMLASKLYAALASYLL